MFKNLGKINNLGCEACAVLNSSQLVCFGGRTATLTNGRSIFGIWDNLQSANINTQYSFQLGYFLN